jgi:hypothetical protein
MNIKYYELPFGAQLLLWTSRIIVNGSCRTNPNKYELVDMAFNKVGMKNGKYLLREFLSFLKNKKVFKLQTICQLDLISNEIELINCIENNKTTNFNNNYFIDIWSITDSNNAFNLAARALALEYEKHNLNTNLSSLIFTKKVEKTNFINNTLH